MSSRLFVGNLPRTATDRSLTELAAEAGFNVVSAVVIRDKMSGESKGFGFIELASGDDLQRAIAGLNGQEMDGRRLTVNEARPQRTGFGGGGGGGNRGGGSFRRRRDY